MGGVGNHNKIRGVSKDRYKRLVKGKRVKTPTIQMKRELTKKKAKIIEKAVRNEKRFLAKKGLIVFEEEMKDAPAPQPGKQKVMSFCIPSEDILNAAASGSGTTLGAPQ